MKMLKVYNNQHLFCHRHIIPDPYPSQKCMCCTLLKTLTFLDGPLSMLSKLTSAQHSSSYR